MGRRPQVDPIDRNFNRAIKLTQSIRDSYDKDVLYSDPKTLISYYQKLIDACLKGIIDQRESAFLIADTVWFKAVSYNPDVEVIVVLATELEQSDSPLVSPKAYQRWENLVHIIGHHYKAYQNG